MNKLCTFYSVALSFTLPPRFFPLLISHFIAFKSRLLAFCCFSRKTSRSTILLGPLCLCLFHFHCLKQFDTVYGRHNMMLNWCCRCKMSAWKSPLLFAAHIDETFSKQLPALSKNITKRWTKQNKQQRKREKITTTILKHQKQIFAFCAYEEQFILTPLSHSASWN